MSSRELMFECFIHVKQPVMSPSRGCRCNIEYLLQNTVHKYSCCCTLFSLYQSFLTVLYPYMSCSFYRMSYIVVTIYVSADVC